MEDVYDYLRRLKALGPGDTIPTREGAGPGGESGGAWMALIEAAVDVDERLHRLEADARLDAEARKR